MKCPVDQVKMRQLEDKGIAMDWCDLCDGIWLDSGELTRLTKTAADLPNLPPEPTSPPRRQTNTPPLCPRCDFMTETVPYGQEASILIDRCPTCHGLWLERGELQEIYDLIRSKRAAVTSATDPTSGPAAQRDSLGLSVLMAVVLFLTILVVLLLILLTQSR